MKRLHLLLVLGLFMVMTACDSGSSPTAPSGGTTTSPYTLEGIVSVFAGQMNASGSADGTGTSASFSSPAGLAFDTSGNLYVADSANHTIRKITSAAVVSTFAGQAGVAGSTDGTGANASFDHPHGLAVDGYGNVYVSEPTRHRIRKISAYAVVSVFAGQTDQSGSSDGNGTSATFDSPTGLAVDASGNLYVADTTNNLIRKVSPTGDVTTLAGSRAPGSADGMGSAASFYYPYSLSADAAGNLYVADTSNKKVRKVTPTGDVTTLAGSGNAGSGDGDGAAASFKNPVGITYNLDGACYVTDEGNNKVRVVSGSGWVSTLAASNGEFKYPLGIAHDAQGHLYVADNQRHVIKVIR